MDEIVSQIVDRMSCALREEFEERAAIREMEAGYSRPHAECLSLLETLRRHPGVLVDVAVVEVEVDGDRAWLLTTDREGARKVACHADGRATFIDLVELIDARFGGGVMVAALTN